MKSTFKLIALFLAVLVGVQAQTIYRLDSNDVLQSNFWTSANKSALTTGFGATGTGNLVLQSSPSLLGSVSVTASASNTSGQVIAYDELGVGHIGIIKRGTAAAGNMGLPADSGEIQLYDGSALGIFTSNTGYLALGTNGTERVKIDGTTGAVTLSNNLTVNGGTVRVAPSSGTAQGRLNADPVRADVFQVGSNWNGASQDDNTKPSWYAAFDSRTAGDQFTVSRAGPATAAVNLLTITEGGYTKSIGPIVSTKVGSAVDGSAFQATGENGQDTALILGQPGVINWRIKNTATTGLLAFNNGVGDRFTLSDGGNATLAGNLTVSGSGVEANNYRGSPASTMGIGPRTNQGIDFYTNDVRRGGFAAGGAFDLTGNLTVSGTGTSSFAGALTLPHAAAFITMNSVSTSHKFVQLQSTGGDLYVGIEGSTAGGFFTGSQAYESTWYSLGRNSRFNTPAAIFTGTNDAASSMSGGIQALGGISSHKKVASIGGFIGATALNTLETQLVKATAFGYNPGSYAGVQIGGTAGRSLLFGVDPSGIAGGNFTGASNEWIVPNTLRIRQVNSAGTDFSGYAMSILDGMAVSFGGGVTVNNSLTIGGLVTVNSGSNQATFGTDDGTNLRLNGPATRIFRVGGFSSTEINTPISLTGGNLTVTAGDATVQRSSGTATNLHLNQVGVAQWSLINKATTGRFAIQQGGSDWMTIDATTGNAAFSSSLTTVGRVVATNVITGATTLTTSNHVVVCNSASAFTVTLIAASSNAGRQFIVKNKGAGTVTLDATSLGQIDGANTHALTQFQSVTLVSDGATWNIL